MDKRTSGDTEGAGIWGDSLGAMSHIKLSQGAFRENPPVSLVPPVSLLVGFPESFTCITLTSACLMLDLPANDLGRHCQLFSAGQPPVFLALNMSVGQNQWDPNFWGFRCTTHFRIYFSGDWDIHWEYGNLTHGHLSSEKNPCYP